MAIMNRQAGDLSTVRNAAIDFYSDRLMVESFSREVEGVLECEKPVALECALDAYADNVQVNSGEGLVVASESEAKPFRALPMDLRKDIVALKKETVMVTETAAEPTPMAATPAVPETPMEEGDDFGDDLEAMFSQRPEDIELIDEYAKDFSVKAGVDEKAAYGYALDAYLEGVSEFWGQVETIQEEEEIKEEEDAPLPEMGATAEEEEEDAPLPEMGATAEEEEEVIDEAELVKKRQSLANGMTESLVEILNPNEDSMEEEEDMRAEVASKVAGNLCQLLTNTALANVSKQQGTEVEEKMDAIVENMGDNIAKLIKSCKKSTKKGENTAETEEVAADIAKDITNLFQLKEEVAPTNPKSLKKSTVRRMSIAADMADSLVGLFASPKATMATGKKNKEARRASLAADMGTSLNALFGGDVETQGEAAINECLEKLMGGSEDKVEIVANSLVDLIQTTSSVVVEDEKVIKKNKAKGRRTSMKRMSLPGDVGETLNNMFGYGEENEEEEEEERTEEEKAKEVDEVAEFLNDVEKVAEEVSNAKVVVEAEVEAEEVEKAEEIEEKEESEEAENMEGTEGVEEVKEVSVDKSLALGLAVDAVLSTDTSEPSEGLDKYSSDPSRKVGKGDKVMVFYEGEGWSEGEVVKVGRGKNQSKLTVLFEKEDMEDTLEYDGDYVVVIDEEETEEMEVEEEESEEDVDFSKLKVAELRNECTKRGLDTKGVKAVLIKRLDEAVEGGANKRTIEEVEGDVEEAPEAKKPAVEEETEETVDFKKLKVAELRTECTKRGLDTKGVKAVLIKRLEEFQEGGEEQGEEMEVEEEEEEEEEKEEKEEKEEEEEEEEAVDFKKLKVAELRAECTKRGLDSKGVKAVLIKRLEDSV